jgi:hypothetical protein
LSAEELYETPDEPQERPLYGVIWTKSIYAVPDVEELLTAYKSNMRELAHGVNVTDTAWVYVVGLEATKIVLTIVPSHRFAYNLFMVLVPPNIL